MKYKWVLRGGKMQRICLEPPKWLKKKKKLKDPIKQRVKENSDLIKERKESKMSESEKVIAKFLTDNCIYFKREYYFPGLFNKMTDRLLFFDFYLPEYKMVIEFDGAYHYKPIDGFESLKKQRVRDLLKTNYCKKKRIKILRIPYWKGSNIEQEICKFFDKHF